MNLYLCFGKSYVMNLDIYHRSRINTMIKNNIPLFIYRSLILKNKKIILIHKSIIVLMLHIYIKESCIIFLIFHTLRSIEYIKYMKSKKIKQLTEDQVYKLARQYAIQIAEYIVKVDPSSSLAIAYCNRWKHLTSLSKLRPNKEKSEAIKSLLANIETLLNAYSRLTYPQTIQEKIHFLEITRNTMQPQENKASQLDNFEISNEWSHEWMTNQDQVNHSITSTTSNSSALASPNGTFKSELSEGDKKTKWIVSAMESFYPLGITDESHKSYRERRNTTKSEDEYHSESNLARSGEHPWSTKLYKSRRSKIRWGCLVL